MRIEKLLIAACISFMPCLPALAEGEAGMILQAGVQKRVTKRFSATLTAELRLRNNFKSIERWSLSPMADYKLTDWLRADAGYMLLRTQFQQTLSTATGKELQRAGYWDMKHRFYVSLTGTYNPTRNIVLSLRERWQYTYRQAISVSQWEPGGLSAEEMSIPGSHHHQLRSFLQVQYLITKSPLTPYANAELFNALDLEKILFTIGTSIKMSDSHTLRVYYHYKHLYSSGQYSVPNLHYIGIAYKYTIPE